MRRRHSRSAHHLNHGVTESVSVPGEGRLRKTYPQSQRARWSIPGIGVLRPCFDRVTIVSSATVATLKYRLPMQKLAKISHSFNVTSYSGQDPGLRSRIIVVGTHSLNPWSLLGKHEAMLAKSRVTQAEIAFDLTGRSLKNARNTMFKLVGLLAKPRHQRRWILSVHKPDGTPPPGLAPEPTFYFEDSESSVKLKCYVRYEKLPGGSFGAPCMRLEWTLTGQRALIRHLGGNSIKDLLRADLNAFLKRNLRLERANYVALGNLFRGIKNTGRRARTPQPHHKTANPDHRAERAAFLRLRRLAYREQDRFGDLELAFLICQYSPAQIRGYCRELRDGNYPRRRGRPMKRKLSSRRPITDYRINACFQQIHLSQVT